MCTSISLSRWALVGLLSLIGLASGAGGTSAAQGSPQASPTAEQRPPIDIVFHPAGEDSGAFFDFELKPGEQATASVVLGNAGTHDLDAVTYAADAYTIRNGGMGLREMDAVPSDPTTWLDYPTEELQIASGTSSEREFSVSVPTDTPPGEYVTGIALQTANPVNEDPGEGMFRIDQYYRSVIGIRIVVPGDLTPALAIGDARFIVEGGIPAIVVTITNTGNQQAQPSGEIRITDAQGKVALSAPVQMGRIYGGHETELWIGLTAPLPEGTYTVAVDLTDDEKHVSVSRESEMTVEATDVEVARSPITIASATVAPGPDADNVQFAVVDATISNSAEPVTNAQLSLLVSKDGAEVERFPISQSLALPAGDTTVNTRYIPLDGWSSGEWTFELLLEQVEGSAAVVVASQPIEGSIVIP